MPPDRALPGHRRRRRRGGPRDETPRLARTFCFPEGARRCRTRASGLGAEYWVLGTGDWVLGAYCDLTCGPASIRAARAVPIAHGYLSPMACQRALPGRKSATL